MNNGTNNTRKVLKKETFYDEKAAKAFARSHDTVSTQTHWSDYLYFDVEYIVFYYVKEAIK